MNNKLMEELERVGGLLDRIKATVLGTEFNMLCFADKSDVDNGSGRVYIQVNFQAPDSSTGEIESFWGRKWYLSPHMIDDEIIKTAWMALESAIKHETMEGFTVDGIVLFNPHINFESLLSISSDEVKRSIKI